MEWYVALLLVCVLVFGGGAIAHQLYGTPYMGRKRVAPKEKVYQPPMIRRHTMQRKQEHKVALAEWMVEFTGIETEWAIRDLPIEDRFVSSTVLQYVYKTDYIRFTRLMEHNRRMEEKLNSQQLDYYKGENSEYWKAKGITKAEYDAKRHSDYY